MADADNYQAHDIVLADRPIFGAGGKVVNQRTVSYYIGDHGPFLVQDKPENLAPAKVKALIEKHIADMRVLDTIGTGQQF
jgi:hypothetical protein